MQESYAPIFNHIIDSSLWEEPLHVRVLFVTMLACKDKDHMVRVSPHHLRRKARMEPEQFLEAIEILESPDRDQSIPQPFDGKRIEKKEDGWLVLNGEKYQEIMRRINKRAAWNRAQAKKRAKEAASADGGPLPGELEYDRAEKRGAGKKELDHKVTEHLREK